MPHQRRRDRAGHGGVSPASADYVVSTVHKVKGMEWPTVLLDPNIAPDDGLDQADMGQGELMLAYVGCTRARDVLDATALQPFHDRRRRRAERGSNRTILGQGYEAERRVLAVDGRKESPS
jgi:superfamily I DNA/RNA helicase